jgi:hypothetical protein
MAPPTARCTAAIALVLSGAACQALSGVGDLEFVDLADASASGGSGGSSGGGAGGGLGGGGAGGGAGGATAGPRVAWLFGLHGPGGQGPTGVHRAPGGSIIVGGHFSGSLAVAGQAGIPATGVDLFLVRLTAEGELGWVETFGADGDQFFSSAIAVNSAGAIFGAGMFQGSLPLGATTLDNAELTAFDAFVVRFSSAGDPNSVYQLAGPMSQSPRGRVALLGDSPIFAGHFAGSIGIDKEMLSSQGSEDGFVSRLYSGASDWAFSFGDSLKQTVLDVHSNGAQIAFTGEAVGSFDLRGHQVSSSGDQDLLLALADGTGAVIWAKTYGDDQSQAGRGVYLTQDSIYLTGQFNGVMNLEGHTLTSEGSDMFVSRHDLAGDCLWAKSFGGFGTQRGQSLYVSPSGDVYVVGTFTDSVDFGGGQLTAKDVDGVILRLDPAGNFVWALPFGGPGDDAAGYVTGGPGSLILVTGSFANQLSILDDQLLKLPPTDAEVDGFVLALEP